MPDNNIENNTNDKSDIETPGIEPSTIGRPIKKNKIPLAPQEKKKMIIKWSLIGLAALIILLALSFIIYKRYYVGSKKLPEKTTRIKPEPSKPITVPAETKLASPINGELVNDFKLKNHPLAVMVENHPDARPQSGLINASAVYEAITEGGITRFMGVFMQNSAPEVGPVRSARSFFVDWASEYNAYYAHAGGAKDALALIPKSNVYDLPDTRGYFERKHYKNVATEHTLYTSTANLYKLAKKKKYPGEPNVPTLAYKDDAATTARGDKTKINIDFSTSSYAVSWAYDSASNTYLRTMGGVAHKDRTAGQQISAKVIAIQTVSRAPIHLEGAKATFQFSDVGSGPLKIFQDGQEIDGTWKKTDKSNRTRFYDSNNKEIELNRGVIWYEITPPGTPVTVS